MSKKARQALEDMGISVILDTPVTDIEDDKIIFGEGSVNTPNPDYLYEKEVKSVCCP